MIQHLNDLSESARWRTMVTGATKALKAQGFELERLPGRGLSNVWTMKKDNEAPKTVCVRTTRDRAIAFPPLNNGTQWRTLDDCEMVAVATVDSRDEPRKVEVYLVPAHEVKKRFNASYKARIKAGQVLRDNFGMWLGLDRRHRGRPNDVGTGLVDEYQPIAVYLIEDLINEVPSESVENGPDETETPERQTISEVITWAKEQIAEIAGVSPSAVKLDLKFEM
jgi:hypothetical protein